MKPLLIEIGVEELPAVPFLKELPNIEKKWQKVLEEFNFKTQFNFFYTPRRLVLWHREFLENQPDRELEFFGPPHQIAFKDGKPTKASEGFAKKCGVSVSELETISKGGKEFLYYKKSEKGKPLSQLLEEMVNKFLESLNFGKSMRWGDGEFSFIRPIHSIVSLFGNENIPIKVFGVESRLETFGHRSSSISKIPLSHSGDYFCNLSKNGVILKQSERELTIRHQFEKIEKEENLKIEIDKSLLDEVVAITEEPTALIGKFEEEFLELPDEVIITSMKEHQRYFPVFKDGKLTNRFIVVSNGFTDDFSSIISGNERVLRARLSDALFFYKNDLKRGLVTDGLEKVVFVNGLGSMADKIEREKKIAQVLAKKYGCEKTESLERAVDIAKADLMSEMVYEFTELQGLMGSYYGEKLGEASEVVTAIREQYLPNSEKGEIPSTKLSSIVAMSYKLDLLFGLFSIGHIPTGSRDPFGLRRAVNGIMRIVVAQKFDFSLKEIFDELSPNYQKFSFEKLQTFFYERVIHFYKKTNPSIIKSILAVSDNLGELKDKIEAIEKIRSEESFGENLALFKRVANILEKSELGEIEKSLLIEEAEKRLFEEIEKFEKEKAPENSYLYLKRLFQFKPHLDKFFDEVMVNVEDEKIRANRKNLLGKIYNKFLTVSDIKEITI